ncbi:MAG: PHP domain-containing protein [Pseudomonadales bacterium]
MSIDLHTHTTASDGALSPEQLLLRAQDAGITVLSITDHDTLDGMLEAQTLAGLSDAAPTVVSGIELSAQWGKAGIHVVGLHFDPAEAELLAFVERQKELRCERNKAIILRLRKLGLGQAMEQLPSSDDALAELGRPQIAAALVDIGVVPNVQKAFKRYLAAGKPASVASNWPALRNVVSVINAAGGEAVLAHPLHYKLTGTRLRALISDFKQAGGCALEVVTGGQNVAQIKQLAGLAEKFGLKASQGSDFHSEQAPWQALGTLQDMPGNCVPIWQQWNTDQSGD